MNKEEVWDSRLTAMGKWSEEAVTWKLVRWTM